MEPYLEGVALFLTLIVQHFLLFFSGGKASEFLMCTN